MIEWEGKTLKVTISMGLKVREGEVLESLLDAADKALYIAKDSGRNQLVVA